MKAKDLFDILLNILLTALLLFGAAIFARLRALWRVRRMRRRKQTAPAPLPAAAVTPLRPALCPEAPALSDQDIEADTKDATGTIEYTPSSPTAEMVPKPDWRRAIIASEILTNKYINH